MNFAPASRLAFSQRAVHCSKFLPYCSSPGAPTTTITVAQSSPFVALEPAAEKAARNKLRKTEQVTLPPRGEPGTCLDREAFCKLGFESRFTPFLSISASPIRRGNKRRRT